MPGPVRRGPDRTFRAPLHVAARVLRRPPNKPGTAPTPPSVVNAILAENGDFLKTENGDYLVQEP